MTTAVESLDLRLWMRKGRLVARRKTIKTIKRRTPSLFLLLQLTTRINMRILYENPHYLGGFSSMASSDK